VRTQNTELRPSLLLLTLLYIIAFYNMVVFLVARRIMTYDFYCCIASYAQIILWFGYESNRNS